MGDLLKFPPLVSRLPLTELLEVDKLSDAPTLARKQLDMIQSVGATAILAAQPLFVAKGQKQLIDGQVTSWSAEMRRRLGDLVWLAPWTESDPTYFTLEGQHLSEVGRTRWTKVLGQHILEHVALSGLRVPRER
jgi:hypothetical protein